MVLTNANITLNILNELASAVASQKKNKEHVIRSRKKKNLHHPS